MPGLRLKGNHDFGSPNCGQRLIERLLATGDYERHIASLLGMYRRKRDALLEGLAEHLGPLEGAVSWTHPRGGLYLWLAVQEGLDEDMDGRLLEPCVRGGVHSVAETIWFAGCRVT